MGGVTDMRHSSFPPMAGRNIRLLILGSLPGARSLAAQQYYAHPQNQFWRLLERTTGRALNELDYEARLAVLRDARIGLWDVIQSASRPSSSDGDIRNAAPQNLQQLVDHCPELSAIAFNGGKASQWGRRILSEKGAWLLPAAMPTDRGGEPRRVRLFDLPSSSAANTRTFDLKCAAWAALAPYVRAA